MRADLQPWTQAGGVANTQTSDLLGLNGQEAADRAMATFQKSPGYDFQMSEGLGAVDAGAAGRGLLRSGGVLKAEQKYGSDLANQEFGTYYNRLFDLSKLGETAAAKQGAASMAAASNIGQADLTLGQQEASIYGNATAGVGNAANNYLNQSLYDQRTKALTPQTTPTPTIGNAYSPSYSGTPSPY